MQSYKEGRGDWQSRDQPQINLCLMLAGIYSLPHLKCGPGGCPCGPWLSS